MKQKILHAFLIPIALFVLGLLIFFLPSYRFSSYILFGLGAVSCCYSLLYLNKGKKYTRLLFWILTALLLAGLTLFVLTEAQILTAAGGCPQESCEYLLVLGAGVRGDEPSLILQSRINAAYDYLTAHPQTICIASGGQGSDENLSEALCIYNHLVARGIDPARILLEEKASSTYENFLFALTIIKDRTGKVPARIAVVTSEFHLYRAGLIADTFGVETVGVPAHTPWLSLQINYFLREAFGVWHFILLGG